MIKGILLLTILMSGFVFAQSVEDCMECHSDEEMTKTINDSIELSLYVDIDKYDYSIHGGLDCIDCHSSLEEVDHDEGLPKVNCAECHDDSQEEFDESIHAHAEGHVHGINITCGSCHGTHYILA